MTCRALEESRLGWMRMPGTSTQQGHTRLFAASEILKKFTVKAKV